MFTTNSKQWKRLSNMQVYYLVTTEEKYIALTHIFVIPAT